MGVPLLNLLLDVGIDHCERLAAARCTQHDGRTLGQKDIDPAVVPLLFIVETGWQVHGVLAGQEACLLLERFVFVVENVVHQVVLQQAAHVKPRHQQADIADCHRENIDSGVRFHTKRQCKHPPVQEKEHEAYPHIRPYLRPCDFFLFHPAGSQTGQREQENSEQFGVDDAAEQPCRTVEIHQDSIDHADIHSP